MFAHIFDNVIAQGVVASPHDAALKLCLLYSCSLGQQTAAARSTVAVHSHAVCAALVKRRAVGHALYHDAPATRLRHVNIVDDACRCVEVVERLCQTEELVARLIALVHTYKVVVGRGHGCCPSVVALLKILAYLLARERHDAQVVLVAVELIHVGQCCRAAFHRDVKRQRTSKRHLCTACAQHDIVHKIDEGARAEIAVARSHRRSERANLRGYISLDLFYLFLKSLHVSLVDRALAHVHDVDLQLLVPSLLAHLQLRVGHLHGVVGRVHDDGL